MKVYQSGGMRKHPRFNVDEGRRVTEFLRHIGWTVISPWEMDETIYGPEMWDLYPEMPVGMSIEECLKRDFEQIEGCDAIVLMDSWVDSDGAHQERRHAEKHGKEVWRICSTPEGYTLYEVHAVLDRAAFNAKGFHDTSDVLTLATGPVVDTLSDFQPAGYSLGNGEIRVIDPDTGAQKGQKLERTDLLPPDALLELARHYGRGARKYADRNWEGGYAWSLSVAALKRHLFLWEGGEDVDEETGSNHMVAVAWHALALLTFILRSIGKDDRGKISRG